MNKTYFCYDVIKFNFRLATRPRFAELVQTRNSPIWNVDQLAVIRPEIGLGDVDGQSQRHRLQLGAALECASL